MEQSFWNWIFGAANIILGGFIKWIWDEHKALREADAKLIQDVNSIKVLVAGEYVKKDEFEKVADTIFAKLDRIYEKLDSKADK